MIALSGFFGIAIFGMEEWYVKVIVGLFCLGTCLAGFAFLIQYFKNIQGKEIIITNNHIQLPFRWVDQPVLIKFEDIEDVAEFETYARIMEMQSKKENYMLDGNWMRKSDFDMLLNELKIRITDNKTEPEF